MPGGCDNTVNRSNRSVIGTIAKGRGSMLSLIHILSIEEINEVKGELLENFLSALKDDIQCASEAKVEALEIYKLELMEEYINKSAALCEKMCIRDRITAG